MACTRRCTRTVKQTFEIHVSDREPGAVIETSERKKRLRFVLLGSPWFLKPFGMLLWSLLHLLLLVAGVSLIVLAAVPLLVLLALPLSWDVLWLPHCVFFACGLILWGIVDLIWSLMRLSWSLIREGERLHQIRAACRRFVEWWNFADLPFMSHRRHLMEMVSWNGLALTRKCVKRIGKWLGPWPVILLGRWCEEIVHVHDTIFI
ncbi:hypothetical protein KC19_10G131000 [Ceratodon purpureus]|uniref:Uncharacterized protein n=1 Tax=Ceratodon purpureus TaxID=3225 RepID=A0A8T0GS86_CERPU|nr:hypothetical protein KC19_10G131000 [Ceratodon purpureus]